MSNYERQAAGLGVVDAVTGQLSWLDAPQWDVEGVALSRDGRVLVWLVNVDGASQLRGRDLTTGQDLPMPALPLGVASDVQGTAHGRCTATGAASTWRISTTQPAI